MTDFRSRTKKLNTIQAINEDPLLSEFKHHFIILKVYLPRTMNLETFVQKIPQGFGLNNNFSNSVYIAQFVNAHQQDLVDVAIGFRRDEAAMQIARGNLTFRHENRTSSVQLSRGFKIFMQQLRSEQMQQKKKKKQYILISKHKKSDTIKDLNSDSKNLSQKNRRSGSSDSESSSNSSNSNLSSSSSEGQSNKQKSGSKSKSPSVNRSRQKHYRITQDKPNNISRNNEKSSKQ